MNGPSTIGEHAETEAGSLIIVCIGVMVLRKTHPELERGYKVPFVPWVPLGGILVCLSMMVSLGTETWIRLVVLLAVGMLVFFGFSRTHSRAARKAAAGRAG